MNPQSSQRPGYGVALALSAFTLWGMFPLYFIAVAAVDSGEVLAHRILGSLVLLAAIGLIAGTFRELRREFSSWRRLGFYLVTSALISANWLIYIWAAQNERVLDASLGYFINPLFTVLLAMVFLGEHINRRQGSALLIAAVGVGISVAAYGEVPWVALGLALTFGSYGLLRKKYAVPAMNGLMIETLLLAPFALLWLLHLEGQSQLSLGSAGWQTDLLLALAGPVTVLPLALWLTSMKHLRLSTVGLLQYLTPTVQFLIGLAYGEPLTPAKLITFGFIWVALIIYSHDSLRSRVQSSAQA